MLDITLKMKTVDISSSVRAFLCTMAQEKPLSAKTPAMPMKSESSATVPNSSGESRRGEDHGDGEMEHEAHNRAAAAPYCCGHRTLAQVGFAGAHRATSLARVSVREHSISAAAIPLPALLIAPVVHRGEARRTHPLPKRVVHDQFFERGRQQAHVAGLDVVPVDAVLHEVGKRIPLRRRRRQAGRRT